MCSSGYCWRLPTEQQGKDSNYFCGGSSGEKNLKSWDGIYEYLYSHYELPNVKKIYGDSDELRKTIQEGTTAEFTELVEKLEGYFTWESAKERMEEANGDILSNWIGAKFTQPY